MLESQINVGQWVRIHPCSDWFMKGETVAVVTSIKKIEKRLVFTVQGRISKIKWRTNSRGLMDHQGNDFN